MGMFRDYPEKYQKIINLFNRLKSSRTVERALELWDFVLGELGYRIRGIPIWAPLVLISAALLLFTFLPRIFPAYFLPENHLAYLSFAQGEVTLSDGASESKAARGPITSRGSRTLLKTGRGSATFQLRDGAYVIMDAGTNIEFIYKNTTTPGSGFAFNLVKGRALVINGEESISPTQVFVGGNFTARINQAVMGLEAGDDNSYLLVDCLVGPCLVNGEVRLVSGQSASSRSGNAIAIAKDIPYTAWIALEDSSPLNASLSIPFTGLLPSLTPMMEALLLLEVTPTALPGPGETGLPVQGGVENGPVLTPSATSTPTRTPWIPFQPSPTLKGRPDIKPSPTPQPSSTPLPSRTPLPQATSTPAPTATPLPTSTPVPTDTPIPVPTATNTRRPTSTRRPTATATSVPPTPIPPTPVPPTDVPPTDVPPTDIPPTDVPPTDIPPTVAPPPNNVPPAADTITGSQWAGSQDNLLDQFIRLLSGLIGS